MNKKLVFLLISVLLVITIFFSITMNARDTITIEMSDKVQEFSGETMSESLLNMLEIKDPGLLQLVTHWGGPMRFYISSDGTIENLTWEMAIKNKNGLYEIYQANKDAGQNLHVTKIDKVNEKNNRNGSISDALVTAEQLPWDSLFGVLSKGDKFGVRIDNIYDKGEKIAINRNNQMRKENDEIKFLENRFSDPVDFYFLRNGRLVEINEAVIELEQPTYEVTFSVLYKKDDGFVGKVEAIVFIPLKKYTQMQF